MNQMQKLTDEINRLETEMMTHDTRPYLTNAKGDRLYSVDVNYSGVINRVGTMTLARFRDPKDAEQFAIAANAALESVFRAFE
jgi:uncharacterized membrane protein